MPKSNSSQRRQNGGFLVGVIVGLLIGLALALGVALYVTKVPIPFINKVPQRTAEQDAAEAEKNRNWDPNAPLAGRNPARPASAAPAVPQTAPPPVAGATPAAPTASGPAARQAQPAPLGGPVLPGPGVSTTGTADAFVYFVQAGAYGRTEEAEAQRAKLAIQGFESKITEREQNGKLMYRVRVGPFNQRSDAETAKAALDGAGMTTALVRVQRQ